MNFVLWMVTTAPLTRSTSGATVPGSAPVPTAPGGGSGGGSGRSREHATRDKRRYRASDHKA